MIWTTIGEGVLGVVKDFFKTRHATAEAKIELEKIKVQSEAKIAEARVTAMINLAASAQEHEQTWERIMAENSDRSWKDEYILLLFSVPLVMSFIPGVAPYVERGFEALEIAPSWYLQIVLAGAAVSYGLRGLTKLPIGRNKSK